MVLTNTLTGEQPYQLRKNPRMHAFAFLFKTSKQMYQLEITLQLTLRAYKSGSLRFLNISYPFKIPTNSKHLYFFKFSPFYTYEKNVQPP